MANAAMAELSGYSMTELTGMKISGILTTRSFKVAIARRRTTNKRPFPRRGELQLVRKDGTERTVEVVSSSHEEGGATTNRL